MAGGRAAGVPFGIGTGTSTSPCDLFAGAQVTSGRATVPRPLFDKVAAPADQESEMESWSNSPDPVLVLIDGLLLRLSVSKPLPRLPSPQMPLIADDVVLRPKGVGFEPARPTSLAGATPTCADAALSAISGGEGRGLVRTPAMIGIFIVSDCPSSCLLMTTDIGEDSEMQVIVLMGKQSKTRVRSWVP